MPKQVQIPLALKDREKKRAYDRAYRLRHKKERKQYAKKYRLAHLKREKKYCKAYRKTNAKKITVREHNYYIKHIQHIKKRSKEYRQKHPWLSSFYCARQRCNNPNNTKYNSYGGKGIRFFLTRDDIKYLWFRDKAYRLSRPSIDRKNSDGNYTVKNCHFIELYLNQKRGRGPCKKKK